MITLLNYNDFKRFYKEEKYPFCLTQDIAAFLRNMLEIEKLRIDVSYFEDSIPPENINWKHLEELDTEISNTNTMGLKPDSAFVDFFGGAFNICETVSDLTYIEGCDFEFSDKHGRWPTMLDAPLGGDLCKYLGENNEFVVFNLCWNNAGGPVFFIPRNVYEQCPNVEASIKMTNDWWNENVG